MNKEEIRKELSNNIFRNAVKFHVFQQIKSDHEGGFIDDDEQIRRAEKVALNVKKLPEDEDERQKYLEVINEFLSNIKDIIEELDNSYYLTVDDLGDLIGYDLHGEEVINKISEMHN